MKSINHPSATIPDVQILHVSLKQEKHALVEMFLASATLNELSAQYKVINDLSERINQINFKNNSEQVSH